MQALLVLARLACLIHVANVHSEPGSNPSNVFMLTELQELRKRINFQESSISFSLVHQTSLLTSEYSIRGRDDLASHRSRCGIITPASQTHIQTVGPRSESSSLQGPHNLSTNQIAKEQAKTSSFAGFPLPLVGRTDLIGVRFEVNAVRPENFAGFSEFFLEPEYGTRSGSTPVQFRRKGCSGRLAQRRQSAKKLSLGMGSEEETR